MRPKKTVYYSDPVNDDFAFTNGKIKTKDIESGYGYKGVHPLLAPVSFVLYRFVATPVALAYCKLFFGLKIKNAKALFKIRGGFFLYGNHTQSVADAFIPSLLTFPRSCGIIASADAFSIPVVSAVAELLNALPVATTIAGNRKLIKYLRKRIKRGGAVAIYPEGHIWPYYNGVRPFSDASFAWPFIIGAPCVAFTVTYRERALMRFLPPLITVTLSKPMYPCDYADRGELRNAVYAFMCRTVEREKSVGYISYLPAESGDEIFNSVQEERKG